MARVFENGEHRPGSLHRHDLVLVAMKLPGTRKKRHVWMPDEREEILFRECRTGCRELP